MQNFIAVLHTIYGIYIVDRHTHKKALNLTLLANEENLLLSR